MNTQIPWPPSGPPPLPDGAPYAPWQVPAPPYHPEVDALVDPYAAVQTLAPVAFPQPYAPTPGYAQPPAYVPVQPPAYVSPPGYVPVQPPAYVPPPGYVPAAMPVQLPVPVPVPVPTRAVVPVQGPVLPGLVPETEPVRVSVDNGRCHIYGICQQEAPEVFRISNNGSLHYTSNVPAPLAAQARQAARCCPMQAVEVRSAARAVPPRRPGRGGSRAADGRRIVVAGGGLAGLSAAARLRERGFNGEVVIVGEELHRPYSRPPLSKQYLSGELGGADLTFRTDDPIDAHWLLGTHLVGLDPQTRSVRLRGGEKLRYDGLVVATGVDAKRLPETPVASARIRTVRTLEDAAAIQRAMAEARAHRVVILGGGFVGCELACTAREHGMDVTLVVHSAPLLRRVLGPKLGEVVGRIQVRAGVDVRLGTTITRWTDTGEGLRLLLDDGETVDADFVVLGLGGEPRTDWLAGSGLDVTDGVLCDTTCHAVDLAGRPVPGVVAAGDVARWPNTRFDDVPRRTEHLIHAVEMGQHAADSLLLGPEHAAPFTPVPRFWSEQHGTRLQAVGVPALGKRVEIVEGSLRSERFVATYHRDTPQGEQTVAAVAFDMPRELLEHRDRIGLVHRAGTAGRAGRRGRGR